MMHRGSKKVCFHSSLGLHKKESKKALVYESIKHTTGQ